MVNGVRHLVQAAHQRSSSVDASRLQHFRSATDKKGIREKQLSKSRKGLAHVCMGLLFFFADFCCVVLCCFVLYIFWILYTYIIHICCIVTLSCSPPDAFWKNAASGMS